LTEERKRQCKKISEIVEEMTEDAIELYDDGKIDRFLTSLEALDLLLDVEFSICERE